MAAAALVLVQSAAHAENPGSPASIDWSGAYAGLQLGNLSAGQGIDWLNVAGTPRISWSPDASGFDGGIFVGYNWQRHRSLVLGVEAEYSASAADGSDRRTTAIAVGNFVETVDTEINGTASIRGRIGYALNRSLFYASAGWAWIDHDGTYSAVTNGVPGVPRSWSFNDQGWTLGLGVEHALSDRIVARVDYRYSNFGGVTYATPGVNTLSGDLETHQIRAGIAMRF